jgi:uncharacterized membrane protein YvbJ
MRTCKQCGKDNNNGTFFCSRACRKLWVREHQIKGTKKRVKREQELVLMSYGSSFSNEE